MKDIVYNKLFGFAGFYWQISKLNLVISVLWGLMSYFLSNEFALAFSKCYLIPGFIISYLFIEITDKTSYFFYYNLGLSKLQLIVFSIILNFLFVSIILGIFKSL